MAPVLGSLNTTNCVDFEGITGLNRGFSDGRSSGTRTKGGGWSGWRSSGSSGSSGSYSGYRGDTESPGVVVGAGAGALGGTALVSSGTGSQVSSNSGAPSGDPFSCNPVNGDDGSGLFNNGDFGNSFDILKNDETGVVTFATKIGIIVGSVIGGICLLALLVCLCLCVKRRRKSKVQNTFSVPTIADDHDHQSMKAEPDLTTYTIRYPPPAHIANKERLPSLEPTESSSSK